MYVYYTKKKNIDRKILQQHYYEYSSLSKKSYLSVVYFR